MYGTSQFATLTGVTVKALHVYERRGLLKPRRTGAGYRRYTFLDMLRLERVVALKGLGLSLEVIAALMRDASRLPAVMARQRELLDERRRRIERAVNAIDTIAQDSEPDAALDRFIGESSWDRWEAKRLNAASSIPRAPDRASPSRVAMFHKIGEALERDPRGRHARRLVAAWDALLEREAGGNPGMADAKRQKWAGRKQWPEGMRRYVSSLYAMEPAAWERVAAFIETARVGVRRRAASVRVSR